MSTTGLRKFLLSPERNGVAGLIFFGWPGSIAFILGGLVASFLLCGYWYPYWRIADMDIMMGYQGFLVNAGYPQDFFDHPGYLSVVLTADWFALLHRLGLLEVASLAQMPKADDAAAFNAVWTQAIRAGRVLSLLVTSTFIVAFALLLRRLIRDWQISVLAVFCLTFSGGLMMNVRNFRTDTLAAALVTCGFMILLIAARSPGSSWRPLLAGAAAALCTLGIVNKVQALFLVMALLPVVPFFGMPSGPQTFWRSPRGAMALLVLAVFAGVLAYLASDMIALGLSGAGVSMPPPFGLRGLYQGLIAGSVAIAMAIFARLWRVPILEAAGAMIAVAAGILLGLLSLKLLYHPQNVTIVFNPIEHMFGWARGSDPALGKSGAILSGQLAYALAMGVLEQLARLTFVLHSSPRPTIFLEWLVVAGAVLAWRRGQHHLAWQVAALLAAASAVDVVGTLRGLKLEYFVFTDPLVVIAAAWLLMHMPDLKTHRWAYAATFTLLAAHVAVSQAEPVKHVFKGDSGQVECGWLPHYASRIERFPFCPPRPPVK
jgi:hypothetical protein